MISAQWVGLAATEAWLNRKERDIQQASLIGLNIALVEGVRLLKGFSSGRPGPNIRTGDYVRSIRAKPVTKLGGTGYIGSPRPQAARLEFGFYGRDSLNRQYNQPPFPHFAPTQMALRTRFPQIVSAEITKALR